ncbi:MAG: hypothetical protein QW179_00625 [Candidatus Hadarchaeales archaeon]
MGSYATQHGIVDHLRENIEKLKEEAIDGLSYAPVPSKAWMFNMAEHLGTFMKLPEDLRRTEPSTLKFSFS